MDVYIVLEQYFPHCVFLFFFFLSNKCLIVLIMYSKSKQNKYKMHFFQTRILVIKVNISTQFSLVLCEKINLP